MKFYSRGKQFVCYNMPYSTWCTWKYSFLTGATLKKVWLSDLLSLLRFTHQRYEAKGTAGISSNKNSQIYLENMNENFYKIFLLLFYSRVIQSSFFEIIAVEHSVIILAKNRYQFLSTFFHLTLDNCK